MLLLWTSTSTHFYIWLQIHPHKFFTVMKFDSIYNSFAILSTLILQRSHPPSFSCNVPLFFFRYDKWAQNNKHDTYITVHNTVFYIVFFLLFFPSFPLPLLRYFPPPLLSLRPPTFHLSTFFSVHITTTIRLLWSTRISHTTTTTSTFFSNHKTTTHNRNVNMRSASLSNFNFWEIHHTPAWEKESRGKWQSQWRVWRWKDNLVVVVVRTTVGGWWWWEDGGGRMVLQYT